MHKTSVNRGRIDIFIMNGLNYNLVIVNPLSFILSFFFSILYYIVLAALYNQDESSAQWTLRCQNIKQRFKIFYLNKNHK